jgi:hypothetical protein
MNREGGCKQHRAKVQDQIGAKLRLETHFSVPQKFGLELGCLDIEHELQHSRPSHGKGVRVTSSLANGLRDLFEARAS